MCIIAIQPMGVKIKENILKNCWDSNNDGAGIMYVENGKIIVQREMHSFSDFMKLKRHADKQNSNIVMHFRIATSGSAILKGNGAGGFSSAAAGTDYAPATSGTALLAWRALFLASGAVPG